MAKSGVAAMDRRGSIRNAACGSEMTVLSTELLQRLQNEILEAIARGATLKAVGQAKENSEKNQAVAEEMVRVNVDAVFESACRFIVMKSLPGWMDEICTEHLEAVRPAVRAEAE